MYGFTDFLILHNLIFCGKMKKILPEVGNMNFLNSVKTWFVSVWQSVKSGFCWLGRKIAGIFRKKDSVDGNQEKPAKKEKAPKVKRPAGEKSLFSMICLWIFRLRSVFLAIPVVFMAIVYAVENAKLLPAKIALYIPVSQQELLTSKMIEFSRDTAVYFPLAVTGTCLLLMFCSRRTIYPWLISIFSLVLPLFFRFISTFPG